MPPPQGEQLVREQADPLQEEHCQSPGGGQHVRRPRRGLRRQPHRLPGPHDVPPLAVGRLAIFRSVLTDGEYV